MKNRLFILLFVSLLVNSCTKREVLFEREVTEEYELALILKLNGKHCFYDAATNTLKYSLDADELSDFSPFTVFQDYSEVQFNGEPLKNNSINSFGDVLLNTPYDIEFKTIGKNRHVNLVFTKIPLVQLISSDEIKNEPKNLARIIVNYPATAEQSAESYIGIEIRGRSSARYDKKSYGFKPLNSRDMDDETMMSFFDMAPNSKWSMDAMFADLSKVRNTTSFEIWNSLPNTSIKSRYVEVFLNNNSLGLYRFSENYTEELLQFTNSTCLYVGVDNSDYTKFRALPENKPKSAIWEEGWEQDYPDPKERIYWDEFYEFSKLVAQSDNQTFINEIENHIDISNVIDYYLFMSLCYGFDNVGKNWFFFKANSSSKFEILVWDLDATWGRNHRSVPQSAEVHISNNLFDRLIALDPNGFKQRLIDRWFSLRSEQFNETILQARFDESIKEIIDYDIEATENRIWGTNVNLLVEQEYLNNWIHDRLIFLDEYFNKL